MDFKCVVIIVLHTVLHMCFGNVALVHDNPSVEADTFICGREATFTCNINPAPGAMSWVKSGTLTNCPGNADNCLDTTKENYQFSSNVSIHQYYMKVNPVKLTDETTFSCKADTGGDDSIAISVATLPSGISLTETGSGNVTLQVTTDCVYPLSSVSIEWYYVMDIGGTPEVFNGFRPEESDDSSSCTSGDCASGAGVSQFISTVNIEENSEYTDVYVFAKVKHSAAPVNEPEVTATTSKKYKILKEPWCCWWIIVIIILGGMYVVGIIIGGILTRSSVNNASKVRIIGGWQQFMDSNERMSLVVGERIQLPFDTTEAGPGKLRAKVKAPSGTLAVDINNPTKGKSVVEFAPREKGPHYIHHFWSDIPLPDSPSNGIAVQQTPDASRPVRKEAVLAIESSQADRAGCCCRGGFYHCDGQDCCERCHCCVTCAYCACCASLPCGVWCNDAGLPFWVQVLWWSIIGIPVALGIYTVLKCYTGLKCYTCCKLGRGNGNVDAKCEDPKPETQSGNRRTGQKKSEIKNKTKISAQTENEQHNQERKPREQPPIPLKAQTTETTMSGREDSDSAVSREHVSLQDSDRTLPLRPIPAIPSAGDRQGHDSKGRGLSANFNDDDHPLIGVDIPSKKAGALGALPEGTGGEEPVKKKKKRKKKTEEDRE